MKLKSLILLAASLLLCAPTASSASPRHNAYMARHQCRDLVNAKGLKGDAWRAEYEKCKIDVINYK